VTEDFLDRQVLLCMGSSRGWLMPARDAIAVLEIFSRQEHYIKTTEYHNGKSTDVIKLASTDGFESPRIHPISEAEILRLQSEWERICAEKGK